MEPQFSSMLRKSSHLKYGPDRTVEEGSCPKLFCNLLLRPGMDTVITRAAPALHIYWRHHQTQILTSSGWYWEIDAYRGAWGACGAEEAVWKAPQLLGCWLTAWRTVREGCMEGLGMSLFHHYQCLLYLLCVILLWELWTSYLSRAVKSHHGVLFKVDKMIRDD